MIVQTTQFLVSTVRTIVHTQLLLELVSKALLLPLVYITQEVLNFAINEVLAHSLVNIDFSVDLQVVPVNGVVQQPDSIHDVLLYLHLLEHIVRVLVQLDLMTALELEATVDVVDVFQEVDLNE
jgi:hypothetical protein